ncbi:MAG: VCBS repeat-containing protein [Balneolales bacterium]
MRSRKSLGHLSLSIILLLVSSWFLNGCESGNENIEISEQMFQHHFIATEMPTGEDKNWGYGTPSMADFDQDGFFDYSFGVREDSIYWFEHRSWDEWARHTVGPLPIRTLGATTLDVDRDGWPDIVIGGYWYRNPQNPRDSHFEIYQYDSRISSEIHDIVPADIDGDGNEEIVVIGDGEGLFWYKVPDDPSQDGNWSRTTVTLDVLNDRDDIHGGLASNGVEDLNGNGYADIVLPDRWLENKGGQTPEFEAHFLPRTASGTRGSFHSLQVADFNGNGRLEIFTVEQEDPSILPEGAPPRWYIWENMGRDDPEFVERVIFDGRLGGHDALVGDVDGDGDLDVCAKIWNRWPENANAGREHADCLQNLGTDN